MQPREYASKILTRAAMKKERERLRAEGRTLVFTNGCFDVLHVGHADYLAFARQQGDALAVGINSDRSVRELKGPQRPIFRQDDRVRLLAALEVVDYVVVFDELHVESLIAEILPDVLVKGEDRKDWVCGREIVERSGGRVALAPVTEGRSTTGVIEAVLESQRLADRHA